MADICLLKNLYSVHWRKACAVRMLSVDAVERANSGHPGMPMGMADVATVLFERHLKFDSAKPDWPDRDRLILSAGHGSMLLYALLHLCGYADFKLDQIRRFRQLGSVTAGHPEFHHGAGIETTTGPLGQGLANAVGFAIAEEVLRARFGREIVDHKTYAIVGDGCLMEGISHEAIGLAGNLKLSRLIVLWDNNGITIDGKVSLSDRTDQLSRFKAAGWSFHECDGHDPKSIDTAIFSAKRSSLPAFVACKTEIGFGSPEKQGTAAAHGAPLGESEIAAVRKAYEWTESPFDIPDDIRAEWLAIGRRGANERMLWNDRLAKLSARCRAEFDRLMEGNSPAHLRNAIEKLKKEFSESRPKIATRKSSELVLSRTNPLMIESIGGSADLTGSNNTKTPDLAIFCEDNRKGRYIHYGVREHAMAGAMNGMALHGGIRPYGGSFLCFTDYARAAIRLSSLMGLPVTYVMTHDSIGLGEDGPTHQPIEHLAMLRATPNLRVFRPCDTVETAESWELAFMSKNTPSILALTRQSLVTHRVVHSRRNLTAKGAYVLQEAESRRQVVLLATGSEAQVATEARQILESEGIGTRVVSMPCWEIFEEQTSTYRKSVLPQGPVRVAIEAAVRQGWDKWLIGERGSERKAAFVGMESYGASAPADDLFRHFGITPATVVERVKELL